MAKHTHINPGKFRAENGCHGCYHSEAPSHKSREISGSKNNEGAAFELPKECKEFVKTMDVIAPFVQTGTWEGALAMAAFFRAFDEANAGEKK